MEKSKVWFSRVITPERVVDLYRATGRELGGRVAVKVHSGEAGNQNFLSPAFLAPMIRAVGGTVVECNTAYGGARNTTEKHVRLLADHGWSSLFDVDIADSEGEDLVLPIPSGKVLKEDRIGHGFVNYDSLLVLSHFKGHPMGGFGGALKQLSIGCASSVGKCLIHSGGAWDRQDGLWEHCAEQDTFLRAMADAASAVHARFAGKSVYINVCVNLSVDCDCCAKAEDPCMKDIGILSSLDPVALDEACLDLVRASTDPGRDHFLERVNSRHGTLTVEAAEALGVGSRLYELVTVD